MKNRTLLTISGFLLIILGITSIVMKIIGVHWVFLGFLEWGGSLLSFILKLFMSVAGFVMIAAARINWEAEKRECAADDEPVA
ncbi:MAG: hypothetical protein IT269_04665 [Saprospiraceae bacterium]|nr:hypothetical protein [Saprospiraceae bacterium]